MNIFDSYKIKSIVFIFTSIIISQFAQAKEISEKNFEKKNSGSALKEIVVTAQKQEQDISEVPVSVSVFNIFDIEDLNMESIEDIMVYTPNMSYFAAGGGGAGTTTSRGITATLRSFSTSTTMYVDGVPYTKGFGFDTILQDIEQVEILRGPQGTLYGKNAEAGVINLTTKKPGKELEANIYTEAGSDEKRVLSAGISGPVYKDKFFLGFSGKHYEKEGYITNKINGGSVNDQKYDFGRVNLRFVPTDRLEISLLAQNISYDNGDLTLNDIKAGDSRKVESDIKGYDKPSSFIGALTGKYRLNNLDLNCVFTYWDYKFDSLNDFDFSSDPQKQYHLRSENEFEKLSAELRASSKNGPFAWMLGVYTDKDKDIVDNTITMMADTLKIKTDHELDAGTIGIFGHSTLDLNEDLSFITGIRYDRDEKSFKEKKSNTDYEDSYSEISPKIALRYKLSSESNLFATVSKGYRAGGFNSFAPTYNQPQYLSYDKETVWNYEIGTRNSFFNKKFDLNFSLFYMKINNMQAQTSMDNVSTYILNAAEATSKGIELEAKLILTKELNLFSSIGYNKVTFDDFSDSKGDYSDNTNPFSPEYNFSIGGKYRSDSGWFAGIDANGYGKMYLDNANRYEKDPFAVINTKAGYETESFDFYISCKNLFDEKYDSIGYFEGRYTIPSPPREVSFLIKYRF